MGCGYPGCCGCPPIDCADASLLKVVKLIISLDAVPAPLSMWKPPFSSVPWREFVTSDWALMNADYVFTKDADCVWSTFTATSTAITGDVYEYYSMDAFGCPDPASKSAAFPKTGTLTINANVVESIVAGDRVLTVNINGQISFSHGGSTLTFTLAATPLQVRCVAQNVVWSGDTGIGACAVTAPVNIGTATPYDAL